MTLNSDGINKLKLTNGMITFVVYCIFQIWAAFIGIDYHIGTSFSILVVLVAFFFRFTLPITIGAFYGAMDVWGWHWSLAFVFAAPGLAFMAFITPVLFVSAFKRS